jgi:hypothetical protein
MVDTRDQTNLHLPAAVPDVVCQRDAQCCLPSCQGDGYTLSCGDNSTCQAQITVTLVQKVDLSGDPNLARAKTVADLTLRSLEYAVCNNSLTVAIPQIEIWLAPEAVTKADQSAGAEKLATIPMIAAMQNVACPPDPEHPDPRSFAKVVLEPNAPTIFATFAHDLSKPFNAIATGVLIERGHDPVPQGSVAVLLTGVADASLSL